MFTEIGIENFKSFGKMQRIPLKPITLLYGPNSSGKSSLMQSLLLLKQTLEEADDDSIVLLPKGNLVDLSSYQEFINGQDDRKELCISISFKYSWDTMAWRDDIRHIAEPSFEFVFAQDKGEILLSSIRTKDSLNPDPIVVCKNIWSIPYLRRAVLERKDKLAEDGGTPAVLDKWLYDLKKSVLVMEHINMVHWLVKYMWEGYTSEFKVFRGHEEKIIYSDETNSYRKETQADLERLKVYLDEEWNKIADDDDYLYREKKAAETSAIADKQKKLEEKEDENKIRLKRFQQMKTIRELIEVIDRALTRGSYEEVLKIPRFPVSSRLISLSNCFLDDKVDLSGEEAWLFRNIPEFVELGKPNIKTNKIYENLNPAHYYFPYVSSLLKEYLRRIIYIGPLREYPERVYSYSGNIPKTVGKAGKYTPDILKKRPDLVDKVNEWFKRFEIDYVLSIDDLKGKNLKGDLFALSLTDTKTGCKVSLKDVGFGIGQLLPILVQGALSENKIMFIEQPEIHLHPRLQAELGSFIAEMAGRTRLDASWGPALNPAEEGYGNQFIIETHSENLILRLQKLIRKGELKKEDVAVIYCDKTTDGTVATELRLNDKGEFIDPWPDGFFEESFQEMFGD